MKNGNEPAFAVSKEICEISGSDVEGYPFGLTKREYIAAKALQGLLSNEHIDSSDSIGKIAVEYADALLIALANNR